jgi:ubiquinone/menaquinone biosynthesis C-methylase UbiE
MDIKNNSWNNSELYNEFMGKWSSIVAKEFINWLIRENNFEQKKWLDVGCGTGALSFEILKKTKPLSVVGIDPSKEYLPKKTQFENSTFLVGSAENHQFRNSEFDIIVSALALNFMTNKENSIRKILKILKPGGTFALYVWDYAEKMEFLRYFWNAVVQENPESVKFDEAQLFPICNRDKLKKLFIDCGIKEIFENDIVIETKFDNFDQYWNSFLGGQGPAGQYILSIEEKRRNDIKSYLKESIPISKDGSINLIARAFAIKGKNGK